MKMLKNAFIGCLLVALTIALASPVNAQILLKPSSDQEKLSRCNNWWECYKQQQTEKEPEEKTAPLIPRYIPVVEVYFPPLVVMLPNLIPTDVDARLLSGNLQIKARVDNLGIADSAGFDYQAEVSFIRADTGAVVSTTTIDTYIPYLLEGEYWDDVIGYITPPDRDYDYDVVMNVLADSTNFASGGAVWESSETDNGLTVTCRIFGYADGQGNLGQYPACR